MRHVGPSARRWLTGSVHVKTSSDTRVPRPVRGTHDLLPEEARLHRFIRETARRHAELSGFSEVQTPSLEYASVFERTLGASSDVIQKEMFRVASSPTAGSEDGGLMVLRPEGTAGVVRAFLGGAATAVLPQRWFYSGSMFRYERPQRGRFREFGQVGIEVLGSSCLSTDVESIRLAWDILRAIGLGQSAHLQLNTIGDAASRRQYHARLHEFLVSRKEELSEESRQRVERGMDWRVLDSKKEEDKLVVASAPALMEHLERESIARFEELQRLLQALDIPFTVNPTIVRGLDYYCETVFEFVLPDGQGHAGTILAGGRYDGLAEQLGGKSTPSFGWAAGVERLALAIDRGAVPPSPCPAVVIVSGQEPQELARCARYAAHLRGLGVAAVLGDRSITPARQLSKASKQGAPHALWVDEDGVTVRDLSSRREIRLPSSNAPSSWPPQF